ncbi:hypothetical protein [Anaeromicropila herbilytica]|uniref:LXG domain-containing protein n=1 Tax=Anaeromicropila herbilytica TaxID=2785025 RepID=A0A7R7IDQ4_9FIRM|nr:hypothetical protein [Anaeromicropila herbilytica]BCN31968.1 hypothetical protein bsdtb5_32630 [Anaeromicropila herbilytica]
MQDLLVKIKQLVVEINTLNEYKKTLEQLHTRVGDVRSGIRSSISFECGIGEQLKQIEDELKRYQIGMNAMKETLKQSINKYQEAEEDIVTQYSPIWKQIYDIMKNGKGNDGFEFFFNAFGQFKDKSFAEALDILRSGLRFETFEVNGVKYIKAITDKTNRELSDSLTNLLGGSTTWTDYLTRTLKNRGIDIYDLRNDVFTRGKNRYFDNVDYKMLGNYMDNLSKSKLNIFGNKLMNGLTFKELTDGFKKADYEGLGKLGKSAKFLGAASTAFDVGSDFVDNFYKDGKWEYSADNTEKFVIDSAVDLGTGAGAVAAGAAIGSFIVPPVGTVVGAASGAAINWAINCEIYDFDGDNQSDSLVDGVKMLAENSVDAVEEGLSNGYNSVCNFVSGIF